MNASASILAAVTIYEKTKFGLEVVKTIFARHDGASDRVIIKSRKLLNTHFRLRIQEPQFAQDAAIDHTDP